MNIDECLKLFADEKIEVFSDRIEDLEKFLMRLHTTFPNVKWLSGHDAAHPYMIRDELVSALDDSDSGEIYIKCGEIDHGRLSWGFDQDFWGKGTVVYLGDLTYSNQVKISVDELNSFLGI